MAEEQQPQSTLDVDTINEAIRRRHSQTSATLDVSDRVAQTQAPDRAAQVQALSEATGLPSQTVDRNFDEVKQKAHALANDPARMREQLPALTKHLSDPTNASVSSDDHENLADMERLATFGGSILSGIDQLQGSIYSTMEATGELVGWNGMAAVGREGRRRNIEEAAQYGRQYGWRDALKSPGDAYTYLKQQIGAQLPVFASMSGGAVAGAYVGEALFPPGGGIVGALIGAWLPRIGAFAPAFIYGAGQVQQAIKETGQKPREGEVTQLTPEQETKFEQWAKQNNITDVDKPGSFYDYRGYWQDVASKGQNQTQMQADGLHYPDTYKQHGHPTFSIESKYSQGPEDGGKWDGETFIPQEASAPLAALIGGSAVAAFDTVLPGRFGSKMVATFGRKSAEEILTYALTSLAKSKWVRSIVGEAAKDMAIEGITEAVQDGVTEFARHLGTGTPTDWEDLASQMGESFAAGATLGAVTGAVTGATEAQHARRAQAVARQQQQFFERLGGVAQQSKTIQRAPAVAEAFLAEATKDGPIATVYAPLESWVSYWQSKGVDPAMVAEKITGRQNALEDAMETGEDLAIPTSRYAAYLAPTEHGGFFVNELRLRPGELNVREADQLLQTEQARPVEQPTEGAPTEPITQDIARQLEAADYGSPEEAKQYAALMSAGIRAVASREGTNAQALYDAYDVAVTRKELPDQQAAEPAPLLTPSATGAVTPAGGQEFAQSEHRIGTVIDSYMKKYGDDWLGKLAGDYNAGRLHRETDLSSLQMRAVETGFTYNLGTEGSPTTGKVVSTRPDLEERVPLQSFDEQALHDFIDRNAATLAEPGAHLGAWVDNGVVYLDISQVVNSKEEAEALARQHQQLAYYDLDSGESVYVNRPEDIARLKAAAAPREGTTVARGGAAVSELYQTAEQRDLESVRRGEVPAPATGKRPAADPNAERIAQSYNATRGAEPVVHSYVTVNEDRARAIAKAYEALPKDNSADPQTREAYAALSREIQAQWDHITANGITMEPWLQAGQPYQTSSEMVADVRDNKHMWFYVGGEPHPLLGVVDASGLSMNDKFRAVHDFFGHAAGGYGFGARGEENAWMSHSQMLSFQARRALTTETRGQNSWVNFGPNSDKPVTERPFAEQKAALLPDEFVRMPGEGRTFYQSANQKIKGLDRAPAERKDGALLVSVRLPSESKNTKAQSKLLVMGLAEFEALPDKLKQAATVIGSFQLLTKAEAGKAKTVDQKIRAQIDAFKRNLKALHDMTPAEWRERAKHWYIGANRIANEFGAEFGFSTDAAAAALANLSPQMDWFKNVDLARRTMKLVREFATSNPVFERDLFDEMEQRALESFDRQSDDKVKRGRLKKDLRILRVEYQGKTWNELPLDGKARLLRVTDERTDRGYSLVTPEGDIDGPAQTKAGEAARSAWGNYRDIGAAISVLLDGSPENINEQLGDKHKVRSFFNNISHPWDDRFVTIDTHAVAAAYFRALSQSAPEVNATMDGGNGSPESAPNGIWGVNGIVAQAYFELADEMGLLPRELQSITWEAIRSLVRPEQKRGAKKVELNTQLDALFKRYHSGKIDHEEYVNGFTDIVGGQEPPAWVGTPISEQGALAVATEHPRPADLSAGRGGEGADTGRPAGEGAREPGRVLRSAVASGERVFGQPGGEPERLAAIRISPNRKINIELYRGANPTSFVHETGHFFVELLGDAANRIANIAPEQRTDSQQQILADFQALMDFAPDEDHKGPGVSVKQHEQLAEAFTKYVLEGKAPSVELRGVFARLRSFMLGIYSRLKLMNTPLTDEVRAVFDRLLASEQAVQEVEATGRVQPMFLTAEDAGMTPEEFALYRKQVSTASRVARERTDQRMMQEIRREQKRAWKAEESKVRDEVESEYQQKPEYRALAAFRTGTDVDGTPLPGSDGKPMKMSKQLLQDIVGKDRVNRFRGLYTTEGGVDPAIAAEAFGFSSADEMLNAIEKAPPYDKEVADEVQHRMVTKYGSVLMEGGAVEEAQRGYSSEDREKVLRAELAALHKLQRTVRPFERLAGKEARQQAGAQVTALKGQLSAMREQTRRGPATIRAGIVPGRVVKQQAEIRLGKTLVRDLKPESFWQAGKVAAVEAMEAAARQEFDVAIDAKNRELLAIALYRGAEDRLDAIEVQQRKMVNLQSKPSQERLGLAGWGIREQVNDVLARYGFAPAPLNPVAVQPMDTWVQSLRNAGIQINDPPPELRQTTRRQTFKTLTVDEFMNVTEGVEELQHVARGINKATANSKHATFKAERDALVQSIRSFGKSRPFRVEFNTKADKRWRSLAGAYAAHRKIADIARALDGFQDDGPMFNGVIRKINDAQNAKFERNEVEAKNLRDIITRHYTPREEARLNAKSHAVYIPSIGTSMTKEGRLALALNWGTDTSRDRLLHDPARRWTGTQIQDILDTLDQRDWKFVEDVWRYLDTFWPEIAAQHKRLTGLEPEKVEGVPVQTKFGIIQGGYYPLSYDGRLSDRVGNMQAWSQLNFQANQSYLTGAVKRGFVQLRNEHVTLPVRLDLNVLGNHIEEVIHALTHHERLTEVAKLLRDKEVAAAIRDRQGDQIFDIFKNALKDIALGGLPSGGKFDPALRWARSNTQMAGLALNLWTAAQQPAGIVNGIQRVGAGWVARGTMRWLRDTATFESTVSWVSSKSSLMKNRHQTALQDRVELRKQLSRPDSWFDTLVRTVTNDTLTKRTLLDGMMWHIGIMQRVADIPTWLGQYEKSKHFGASEDEAIAQADQAVIDSQGSGLLKDLSELQRGSEFGKLWMTFYSYGNMTFNQAANATERAAQTIQSGQGFIGKAKKTPAAVVRALGDYTLIYVVPALITVAMGHALGREDDKKSWWKEIVRETFSAAMNGIVGVRELALLLREGTRGYEGPAGARTVSSIINVGQQVKQGKMDKGLERAAISASGAVFGFPAAQMQRTVDGYEALKSGKAKNPLALIFGPARR